MPDNKILLYASVSYPMKQQWKSLFDKVFWNENDNTVCQQVGNWPIVASQILSTNIVTVYLLTNIMSPTLLQFFLKCLTF